MDDKITPKITPVSGLGGFLLLGGAAALTYVLWPKKAGAAPARVPTPGSSGGGSTSPSQPSSTATTPTTSPEELGWEASPQGEASGAGTSPTWYLPGGQTGPSWYNGLSGLSYGADDPRPVQFMQLAEQVSRAQSLIDSAYARWVAGPFARVVGARQNVADLVASSQALAGGLIDALHALAADPDATYEDGSSRVVVVTDVAARYVGRANSIVQMIGAQSAGAELVDFIARFPSSLRTVLSYTVDTAGDTAAGLAWGISKPVLIVGGALALLAFMLSRAGVSVNAGPVKVKAKE